LAGLIIVLLRSMYIALICGEDVSHPSFWNKKGVGRGILYLVI